MLALFMIGRIAFALIFIISGISKFMDLSNTSNMIAAEVVIPGFLSGAVTQIETTTGMRMPMLLAVAGASIEVIGGAMVALNFASRIGALLLILFLIPATYFFHDFWTMTGEAWMQNLIQFQKNLSILGGLIVFFVLGSWRPGENEVAERETVYERPRPVERVERVERMDPDEPLPPVREERPVTN
jgi:putative oxidoreductase